METVPAPSTQLTPRSEIRTGLLWALISSAKSEQSPLIIDNAPCASEAAKKHDKKDGHQGFSDYQRHKLVYLECHSAASRCRTTRVAFRFF
jgi:hypothetical protein